MYAVIKTGGKQYRVAADDVVTIERIAELRGLVRQLSIDQFENESRRVSMGAGKSTVGRRLARALQMRFVDLDQVIEAETGSSIALLFEIQGEAAFRERESAALARTAELDGIVLATGASLVLAQAMQVPYVFSPGVNLLSFLFSAGIGVLFGYFPARRAARMDPIEALRHE